ncbi:ABC transporter ATP-binding protein, partial [Streptomyces clavuligerus]
MQPVQQVVFTSRTTASSGGSGLSGPPDFPEPAPPRRPRGAGGRLRQTGRSAAATAVGAVRVFRLVWAASPWLTTALGLATVLIGLVPAATAMTARLLVDTVVQGAALRAEDGPDRIGLTLPLPGGSLELPVLTVVGALVALATAQFVVYALGALATAVRSIAQQLLQERTSQDVQLRVMEHAGRLPLSFFEDSRSYDLLRQAQQEASTRPVTMISGVFGLLQTAVTFVSMVGLLIGLGPLIALAALIAPVPAFVADARYGMRTFVVALWSSPIRRRMEYLSRLVATDSYAKEVKVFGLAPFLTERFRLLGATAYRGLRKVVTARYLVGGAWSALATLVGSLTYLYVALQAVNGRLSLGDLVLYTSAATTVQTSVQGIFSGLAGMYENNLYLGKLYELLAVPAENAKDAKDAENVEGAENAKSAEDGGPTRPGGGAFRPLPSPLRGHVVLENVTFRYPGTERPALLGVSLEIRPGQSVAVVGPNGAGKSTLIKLLCRLYEPDEGRILLDGVDIRELDPELLRRRIGAMFQDHVSYQATMAENIGLGDVDRIEDRARVAEAARRAGADGLAEGLPQGYDTALGKWFATGAELSGGQWQKVALARAFMRDATLLVLDEPTSALDAEAEADLFGRLRELAHGRTTVYISHRFSTVRRADLILLIEDGRVAEQGTHRELIALGGRYARLFALQASAYTDTYTDTDTHTETPRPNAPHAPH